MQQTPQGCPDEESKALIETLRQINKLCSSETISWAQRRAMHNALVQGIGDLETETKGRGKEGKGLPEYEPRVRHLVR